MRTKAKAGRPRRYSDELAEMILEEITSGVPLAVLIRRGEGCPSHWTVRKWATEDPTFAARLRLARVKGFEPFVRRLKEWGDTPEDDNKWRRFEAIELSGRSPFPLLAKWDPKRLASIVLAGKPVRMPADLRGPVSLAKVKRQRKRLQESVKGLREQVKAARAERPA